MMISPGSRPSRIGSFSPREISTPNAATSSPSAINKRPKLYPIPGGLRYSECAAGGVRMIQLKRSNKLALALFASSLPLFAADEALPSVETVMNHFIAATGGKAVWEARHSQVEHATI